MNKYVPKNHLCTEHSKTFFRCFMSICCHVFGRLLVILCVYTPQKRRDRQELRQKRGEKNRSREAVKEAKQAETDNEKASDYIEKKEKDNQ